MKVSVLGASGMLGHRMVEVLAATGIDVTACLRLRPKVWEPPARIQEGLDVRDRVSWSSALSETSPDVVVNCAGIVKQRNANRSEKVAVNAMFPHYLAAACRKAEVRLIHISTDCVFSGREGMRNERDDPDPVDEYGMSKFLGEPTLPEVLTLRTSMVGLELTVPTSGLIEWALAAAQPLRGFTRAYFSGLTTTAISSIVSQEIRSLDQRKGLYHLASQRISKFDLLSLVLPGAVISPDDSFVVDRSLDGRAWLADGGSKIPTWEHMAAELRAEIALRQR